MCSSKMVSLLKWNIKGPRVLHVSRLSEVVEIYFPNLFTNKFYVVFVQLYKLCFAQVFNKGEKNAMAYAIQRENFVPFFLFVLHKKTTFVYCLYLLFQIEAWEFETIVFFLMRFTTTKSLKMSLGVQDIYIFYNKGSSCTKLFLVERCNYSSHLSEFSSRLFVSPKCFLH